MTNGVLLVITRGDDHGGAQRHVVTLAQQLRRRNVPVVVAAGSDGFVGERLRAANIEFRVLPDLVHAIRPWRDLRAVRGLGRLIDELTPAVVSAHSSKAGLLVRLLRQRPGTAIVPTVHGCSFMPGVPAVRRVVAACSEYLVRHRADGYICVSPGDAERYRRFAKRADVACVANGVGDLGVLRRPRQHPPTMVMLSRLDYPKHVANAIEATALLVAEIPTVRLLIAGDGPERNALEALIERRNLTNNVTLLGAVDDIAAVLRQGDVFVLSSRYEAMPLALLEAMSAEMPCVATDVGAVRDMLGDDGGVVVDREDSTALAAAVRRVLLDEPFATHIATAARARYLENYSDDRWIANTMTYWAARGQ